MLRLLTIASVIAIAAAVAIQVVEWQRDDGSAKPAAARDSARDDDLSELTLPKQDDAAAPADAADDPAAVTKADVAAAHANNSGSTNASTGATTGRSSSPTSTSTSTTTPKSAPRSTELLAIGDSLTVGTDPYLRRELDQWSLTIDAQVGRHLDVGMRRYDTARSAGLPDTVMLGLLTNDAGLPLATFQRDVQRTIDDARARRGRVIWLTVHDSKGSFDDANAWLRTTARRNPDVLRVVDWDALVEAHPEYLAKDGVHGTPDAYAARAALIARAASRDDAPAIVR